MTKLKTGGVIVEQPLGNSEQLPSVFDVLSNVPVNNKVRQKGNFWYVSWSNAVRELLKRYPKAEWDFSTYDGLPYLKTETGYFVACTVTVDKIARTQMMPVLDHRNKVIEKPDASQINKAQMRALTKAIALHGFGLDLWAGEDLDSVEEKAEQAAQERTLEPYCSKRFADNLPSWITAIKEGKITKKQIIDKCSSRATLTEEQIKLINKI